MITSDSAIAEYAGFARHLSQIAGRIILPHFRAVLAVENKETGARFDPVTIADREAERAMREEITRVYPSHAIFGEEHGVTAGRESLTWILDPIDGTRAFIIGQLHWGVLIALNDGERPIVGLMHQPYTGETVLGSRMGAQWSRDAECNAIKTRSCARIEDAIVCATDPAMFKRNGEREAFDAIARRSKMRRFGGDCYSYCLLAAGLIDLVIEAALKPYDIQPLIPIIEAAGGVVTSWSGKPAYAGGQCIAAGDRDLHRLALEVLSGAANDS